MVARAEGIRIPNLQNQNMDTGAQFNFCFLYSVLKPFHGMFMPNLEYVFLPHLTLFQYSLREKINYRQPLMFYI